MGKKIIGVIYLTIFFSLLYTEPIIVSGGWQNDYESWLTRLSDHRIMLVFCRNPNFNAGELYVTFSENDGYDWSEPQLIISAPGDQTLASFVQLADDTFRLFYSSNENGNYCIHEARSENGLDWEVLGQVDLGWNQNVMHYDPNIFLCHDESLIMTYVVSGQGVFVASSEQDDEWDNEQQFIDNSAYRPRIIQTGDSLFVLTYHKHNGPGQYDYDVFVKYSPDFQNWSEAIQVTTNNNSHDPFIQEADNGTFYLYYAKYTGSCYKLRRRISEDLINWSEEEIVTQPISNDTQPHFFIEDDAIYLSWAHAVNYPDNHDVYFQKFSEEVNLNNDNSTELPIKLYCYPNPFNPVINISFALKKQQKIKVSIYNLKGERIKILCNRIYNIGNHSVNWNGTDSNNKKVSSGVYFYKFTTDEMNVIKKLMLLK